MRRDRGSGETSTDLDSRITAYLNSQLKIELAAANERYAHLDFKVNWLTTRNVEILARAGHKLHEMFRPGRAAAAPVDEQSTPVVAPSNSAKSRLLLDVTSTRGRRAGNQVHRIVAELERAARANGEALPTIVSSSGLHTAVEGESRPGAPIVPSSGDTFLMAGEGWLYPDEQRAAMQRVTACGGTNVSMVYEVTALVYPGAGEQLSSTYAQWLHHVALCADGVVVPSRHTGNHLADLMAGQVDEKVPVEFWTPGAELSDDGRPASSPGLDALRSETRPNFLSVGPLSLRNAYSTALDALERLWAQDVDVTYAIVGDDDWSGRALHARILGHPEFGRRLHWLEQVSDGDLRRLYQGAAALIAPAFDDGVGLCLMEAAALGTPVIAADTPIFREVVGETAVFFDLFDSDALAECLHRAIVAERPAPHLSRAWSAAAADLFAIAANFGKRSRGL